MDASNQRFDSCLKSKIRWMFHQVKVRYVKIPRVKGRCVKFQRVMSYDVQLLPFMKFQLMPYHSYFQYCPFIKKK